MAESLGCNRSLCGTGTDNSMLTGTRNNSSYQMKAANTHNTAQYGCGTPRHGFKASPESGTAGSYRPGGPQLTKHGGKTGGGVAPGQLLL